MERLSVFGDPELARLAAARQWARACVSWPAKSQPAEVGLDWERLFQMLAPLRLDPEWDLRLELLNKDATTSQLYAVPSKQSMAMLEQQHPALPVPPGAAHHFMHGIQADDSPFSYLLTSFLVRDSAVLGSSWHHNNWSRHLLLTKPPVASYTEESSNNPLSQFPAGEGFFDPPETNNSWGPPTREDSWNQFLASQGLLDLPEATPEVANNTWGTVNWQEDTWDQFMSNQRPGWPEAWEWPFGPLTDWRPFLHMNDQEVKVSFLTLTWSRRELIVRHTDRYRRGYYVPLQHEQVAGLGPRSRRSPAGSSRGRADKKGHGIERFLSQRLAEGVAESSGAFTIDGQRARSKLGRFQLADPGTYVLKMIQAAVRAGAQGVSVNTGPDRLTMRLSCPCPEIACPQGVAEALFRVPTLQRSALRHLAVGLNAACAGPDVQEVRWETPQGSLLLTAESIRADDHVCDHLQLVVKRKRSLLRLFSKPFRDELSCLMERCLFAPLELSIDGRSIDRPVWDHFSRPVGNSLALKRPRYLLESVEGDTADGGGFWLSVAAEAAYQETARGGIRVCNRPDFVSPAPLMLRLHGWSGQPFMRTRLALGVTMEDRGGGWAFPVLDGITLEPLADLNLGHPDARVLFDAGDLATDLSEMQLVAMAAITDWLRQVVTRTTESLSRLEVEEGLRVAGLGDRYRMAVERTLALLNSHGPNLRGCLLQHLAGAQVQLAPAIEAKKEAKARAIYQDFLPLEEPVLALYDDVSFMTSFVVTDRRLCWKCHPMEPSSLRWDQLATETPRLEGDKLKLSGYGLITGDPKVTAKLADFLREVALLDLEPSRPEDPDPTP